MPNGCRLYHCFLQSFQKDMDYLSIGREAGLIVNTMQWKQQYLSSEQIALSGIDLREVLQKRPITLRT